MSAGAAHPLGLNENHPYGIISNAYETPHVKWARPYRGGAVKALVLAPMWSHRETVELAQRLSLDYTAWMSETFQAMSAPAAADPAFAFFQPPPAVVYRHLRECIAKDYDVIVIGKLDWAMLTDEQRLQLLEKASRGTGLVYVGPPAGNKELQIVFGGKPAPAGREFVTRGVPLGALPAFKTMAPEQIVRTSMFDKGRVVVLDYGPIVYKMESHALTPRWTEPGGTRDSGGGYSDEYHKPTGYVPPDKCPELEFVPYEYYQSLVARAVLWAGRREIAARLTRLVMPTVIDYPASAHSVQVTTAAAPAGAALKAVVRHRYEYERVLDLQQRPAGAENSLALPAIPAGDYFVDVWLIAADANVLDWASAKFAVKADADIREISLARKSYNPGDAVKGQVLLSRPMAAGEALSVELRDNYGRKIAEQPHVGTGETIPFAFVIARPLTVLHSIRARVVRQGNDVCASRLNFPVRANLKRAERFNEVLWSGAGNTLLANLMLRKLSKHDQADAIDVGFSGATHARNIAAADLAAVPYTRGFGHFGTTIAGPHRSEDLAGGCMTNPATHKAVDDWFGMFGDIYGPYGPLGWSHGDESYYAANPDTCWSETCLAAFREYLKTRYSDLAGLNRDWGTKYANWAAVMPLAYDEAKATGNYAPWIEHRLSSNYVWARLYRRTGEAMQRTDAGALVGFDGPQGLWNPNSGLNWWVLKDHVGVLQDYLYNAESMEIFRSFATPKHLSGMWYGTYGLTWDIGPNTVPAHHYFPWYCLFHGLNSTWMWTMGGPGPLSGYAPDLTNLPFFEASRQSLKTIRSGVFTLLHTGRRANDGIAIHYSEASRVADSLFADDKRCTAWAESLADFNHAVEDCGLQYDYVAYEQIEQDALRQGRYRVLLMPHSRAVSEKEAAAIRGFVQQGGLLIADIMPGMLNGHGSKQARSVMADLFPKTDPGIVHAFGKGKTVLLGNKLAGYGGASHRHRGGWKKLEGRWRLLADLLREHAGLAAPVSITHRAQGEMPPTEVTRFVAGDAEFVGLLRKTSCHDHGAYPAAVRFPDKRHVYDVRAGKYLGFLDSVTTEISYEAQLYARLPYRVAGIELAGPDRAAGGGRSEFRLVVQAESGARPGAHAFRVEVLGPGGVQLPWYAANLTAERGRAICGIDWALNDPAGRYTVVVRDVASGTTAKREVTLR
jgi:hypothetical protein